MKTIEDKILELKKKLECIDTVSLLGYISLSYYTFADEDGNIEMDLPFQFSSTLMSPQKQRLYLAGLLMSTDQLGAKDIDYEIKEIEDSIEEITYSYIKRFLATERFDVKSEEFHEIKRKRLVSLDAFISYFDTGILRYEEQTYELINTLYLYFSDELRKITGLTISDYLDFYSYVKAELESANQKMIDAKESVIRFLNGLNAYNIDNIENEYQRLLNYPNNHFEEIQTIHEGFDGINKIKKDSIISKFGNEKANLFLNLFSLKRKKRDFTYYNQKNPFVEKPLCWVDDDTLFLISPQTLLTAIYNHITDTLEKDDNSFSIRYKKKKSQIVEEEFKKCFYSIFGEEAKYHKSVCEKVGTQEHDIVIEYKNFIIIAEVKASKVHEPFFNPDKSYERIKRHFYSKNGIGYAYKQAVELKKILEIHDDITLYENMKDSFHISELRNKEVIPVVLTLEQFGGIAINTSLLLHPEDNQPYPWVCNLHDFQNIIEILNYLHKSADDFVEYILWRSKRHEDILAGDELDIIEWYFANQLLINTKDKIFIDNNMTDSLIDKIYYEKKGLKLKSADQYTYFNIGNKMKSNSQTVYKNKKIYPNDPCYCGSGKKYKKCHGKK